MVSACSLIEIEVLQENNRKVGCVVWDMVAMATTSHSLVIVVIASCTLSLPITVFIFNAAISLSAYLYLHCFTNVSNW